MLHFWKPTYSLQNIKSIISVQSLLIWNRHIDLDYYMVNFRWYYNHFGAPVFAQSVKNQPAMQETLVLSLGWEDSLEEEIATHSNSLTGKIPCIEETGGLHFTRSQRVRHNLATKLPPIALFYSHRRYNIGTKIIHR